MRKHAPARSGGHDVTRQILAIGVNFGSHRRKRIGREVIDLFAALDPIGKRRQIAVPRDFRKCARGRMKV
jgi:hypothetical protein